MTAGVLCTLLISLQALSPAAREELAQVLEAPVLAAGVTRDEVTAYLRARAPRLQLPEDAGAWTAESERLRTDFLDQVIFRGAPEEWRHSPLNVEYTETLEPGEGYRIRKLRYEALPGLWIPAVLYEPREMAGKLPAVLNVNGHVGPPGKAIDYEQIRCINLARRGMLALHPEWIWYGELGGPEYNHNRLAYLDLVGVSGSAVMYLAMQRGLDVLEAHAHADPERLGMTGLSGGGWQTIFLSALDPRITLSAPNAGHMSLYARPDYVGDIGDLEQAPIDMLTVADYTHLTAMLAPRPTLLIYNAEDACCFKAERAVPDIYEPVKPFFGLFDAQHNLALHINHDPGSHNYELDNREAFYRFSLAHFGGEAEEHPTDLPLGEGELFEDPEALYVGVPENNATFASLALEFADQIDRPEIPAPDTPEFAAWQETTREALREVLRVPQFEAGVTLQHEARIEGVHVRAYLIRFDEVWTAPLLLLEPEDSTPERNTIFLHDEGRAAQADAIFEALGRGERVALLDVLLTGEAKTESPWQFGMLVHAAGGRLLGEQAAQILAAVQWMQGQYPAGSVALRTHGHTTGMAALVAAGLAPALLDQVMSTNPPLGLRALIEQGANYNNAPSLFAFGLLQVADLPELLWLAHPTEVSGMFSGPLLEAGS